MRPVYSSCLIILLLQAEERTLWQAQKTYIDMSPYMYADRVKKPLLLIHGDEDNNAGTMTMQVHFRTIASLFYPSWSLSVLELVYVVRKWLHVTVGKSTRTILSWCWTYAFFCVIFQSERFFSALKGHGALTRLVLLPLESHGYQGRESVMHCLWEMDRWLQTHCVNAIGITSGSNSRTDASEVKPTLSPSGTGGGSAPECAPTARTFTCGFGPLSSL